MENIENRFSTVLEMPQSGLDPTDEQSLLVDTLGREHTDLRVSLTDKCNFRCVYCMKEDRAFEPMNLELTTPELLKSVEVAKTLGINAVRLTGGEPLVRKDAVDVVGALSEMGFNDLSMTSNGSLLTRKVGGISVAQALKNAGLQRINISFDSLKPDRFEKIRRRSNFEKVMAGINEALEVGLDPVKLNVVLIRGINDDEILNFADFARKNYMEGTDLRVRFIEYMPLGDTGEKQEEWRPHKIVGQEEILETVRTKYDIGIGEVQDDHAPAGRWAFKDGQGEISIIPTMTNRFCGDCNRLRLTADGVVLPCLFSEKDFKLSVRNVLRNPAGYEAEDLAKVFKDAVSTKKWGQNRDKNQPGIFEEPGPYADGNNPKNNQTMSQIGG